MFRFRFSERPKPEIRPGGEPPFKFSTLESFGSKISNSDLPIPTDVRSDQIMKNKGHILQKLVKKKKIIPIEMLTKIITRYKVVQEQFYTTVKIRISRYLSRNNEKQISHKKKEQSAIVWRSMKRISLEKHKVTLIIK